MDFINAYLLVDGYNVLNSWSEFKQLKDVDLAHARDKFIDIIVNYAAFKGYQPIIVFDAYAVSGQTSIEEKSGVQVVFTQQGQTADSYIEKTTYELLKLKNDVFVVTGDYSEQMAILGMGAYRLTTKELEKDYKKCLVTIKERIVAGRPLAHRQELGARLKHDVAIRLDTIRKNSNRGKLD